LTKVLPPPGCDLLSNSYLSSKNPFLYPIGYGAFIANFFFKVYALCFCSVSGISTGVKDASL